MLLSDHAGADPIPVLEILTNDVVRCGHGATAGALGDEDLFYAMSRGFDRELPIVGLEPIEDTLRARAQAYREGAPGASRSPTTPRVPAAARSR